MPEEREPMTIAKDDDGKTPSGPQNWKERIYERLRMPLWVLDLIICLLVTYVPGIATFLPDLLALAD